MYKVLVKQTRWCYTKLVKAYIIHTFKESAFEDVIRA